MTASALASGAYIVIVVGGAVLAGAAASSWCASDALDRMLAGTIAALAAIVGAAIGLGMFSVLSRWPYGIVLATIGVISAIVLVRRAEVLRRVPAAWSPAGTAALALGVFLAALTFMPTLHGLASGAAESRRYHITNLVSWVQTHTIWRLPFQSPGVFTATHPGNGEIAAAGLLFATGRDQLVYTTFAFFGAICVIAAASIARDLGGPPDRAALTMLAFVATPLVYGTEAHALMSDMAAAAPLLAGIACVLRARRESDARWIVTAGGALGLGLGAKYTVLWLVPVVVAGAFFAIRPRRRLWWLVPGLALFGAPWFVRNLIDTGNPIFPQGLAIAGHQILRAGKSPFLSLDTTIATHVLDRHWVVLGRYVHLLWHFWGPTVLLLAGGIAFAFIERPRHPDRMIVASFAVFAIAVYAVTPFTGAGPNGLAFLMGSSLRYLLPAGIVAVTLAAVVLPSRVLAAIVAASIGFDVLSFVKGFGFRSDLDLHTADVLVCTAITAVVCAVVFRLGRRTADVRPIACAGAVAGCVLLAAAIVRVDSHTTPTELERLVATAHVERVAVLGATDFRSILGPDLRTQLEDPVPGRPAGDPPPATGAALAKDVESSDAQAIVVSDGTPGVPKGWQPSSSGWTKVGTTPAGDVYVRKPQVTPPPTPGPSVPP
jgi:hypothetical protein